MSQVLADKISDAELEVMKLLWRADDALPIQVIRTTLQKTSNWEATTIKTMVNRLLQKGVIRQEKRDVFYYSPLVSEEEYNKWATKNLIWKLFDGSAVNFIASLVRTEELTRNDIEELRTIFKMKE